MRTVSSTRRIASTAAWSAASLSPRPTQRARGERGGLGHADELEGEVAVGQLVMIGHARAACGGRSVTRGAWRSGVDQQRAGARRTSRLPAGSARSPGGDRAPQLLELPRPLRGEPQVEPAALPRELADRAQRFLGLLQRRRPHARRDPRTAASRSDDGGAARAAAAGRRPRRAPRGRASRRACRRGSTRSRRLRRAPPRRSSGRAGAPARAAEAASENRSAPAMPSICSTRRRSSHRPRRATGDFPVIGFALVTLTPAGA